LAALIDELLLAGPNAAATAKGLVRRLGQAPVSKELLVELQRDFDARRHSPEAVEGVASFREKRKPRWAAPEHEQ
jgi:enoyl-CoA hydratase/carnithine racemase